ncbi:unnamed protein product [Nesidiocoris tenuis]|uniref:GOLD domain-containing protein n=1 Tax=Nesidiocoris tenuis TaxID=355587 RepID=A0A6H5GUU6_9HEMI|nr:unnamed protein product [Nesidiocoris tenuis]
MDKRPSILSFSRGIEDITRQGKPTSKKDVTVQTELHPTPENRDFRYRHSIWQLKMDACHQYPIDPGFHKNCKLTKRILMLWESSSEQENMNTQWHWLYSAVYRRVVRSRASGKDVDRSATTGGTSESENMVMRYRVAANLGCSQAKKNSTSDYGTGTPNALPTSPGTGKGPLEIPPGAKFPCQFGNRWITESQPQAGSNVGNSRRVCCVECVKYPPLEQSYNAKSANENQWSRSNNQFGTEPIKCCVNNSNLVTVPCPAASQDERQDGMKCGLRALADPNQRNLSNLLQPTLFSPECPADSTGRRLSLCTCPKVPAIIPERATGNSVRCECKNILKALKPVDIPDLCPKSQPGSSNNPYADCPPCPPVPINLPPPTADCALAKLLQEAMNDQTSKPVGDPEKLPTTPQFTQPNIRSESGKQVSEPESEVSKDQKSAKTPESPTDPSTATIQQSPTSKPAKTKEKVQKILQEEVDKFDRIQSNDDVSSKLTSLDSESSAPLKRKKRSPKVGKQNETKPPVAQPTPTEKKRDLKYTPTAGIYPGMVIGHRDCIPPVFLVPKNMGWLWNISNTEGYMKFLKLLNRTAWQCLGDLSAEDAMVDFVELIDDRCPLFRPYAQAHRANMETRRVEGQRENGDVKENCAEANEVAKTPCHEDVAVETNNLNVANIESHKRNIMEALNRQTYGQFKAYAEQHFPDDPAQQEKVIVQLQEQHYQQYIEQMMLRLKNADQEEYLQYNGTNGHIIYPAESEEEAPSSAVSMASLWTREDIKEFKDSIRKEGGDSIIKVGHGETVTIRVPTSDKGTCLFWEFATDYYDIGFGVYFEWTKSPTNQVSVHVSESEDDEDYPNDDDDDDDEDDEEFGLRANDLERGAAKLSRYNVDPMRPLLTEILPVRRRDCMDLVYAGSHAYPGTGVYLLKFDNSYSLWRSKTLYYKVYYTT